MKKTKFLFCLFDGLRRDFVKSNIMPNLNEFRNEWVDYPNSSSTFPSETRVQVSSFVTGAYCGGSISDASKKGRLGHGIMANSFYDPILGFDGPLDTSDMARMEEAKVIYGSLQKTPSLGKLLAKENKNYSVITTGKIGNARLLNLNADELQQRLFSIWGADISSELADYQGIIKKFGPVPKQSFPNNQVSQYATQILLDHFLLDRSVDVQVIWYNEPDLSFHYEGIGSKASLSSLECLDKCFGKIMKWWNAEGRSDGWNVIVCSDHAQISKQKQVSVINELKRAGFKTGVSITDDIDVAVKASYSGQITVRDRDPKLVKKIIEFLHAQDWCGLTFTRDGSHATFSMAEINALSERLPDINYMLRTTEKVNQYGYAGSCFADNPDIPNGGGIHGGLSRIEINNFMTLGGDQMNRQKIFDIPTGIVDILPTIFHGLGIKIPKTAMGRPLKEAFLNGQFEPTWSETNLMASSGHYSQEMCIANVEGVTAPYLRGGRRVS